MGMQPGLIGGQSGYVVVDFAPLADLRNGRSHHDSVALGRQACTACAACTARVALSGCALLAGAASDGVAVASAARH